MVMMAGEKKLHYLRFYGGNRGDADFSCPIITGLHNFVVTLRYGNIDNANISFCSNSFFWANGEISKIWSVAI